MNASAPINRLPREVLTNVFALCPRGISHGDGEQQLAYWPFKIEIDVGDLHKLTKVCRYWRDLAIATPTLWTTVGTSDDPRQPSFRRSIYLPSNRPPALIVHVDRHWHHTQNMLDFVLKNASNIREFHAWEMASIPDVSSFLQQFNASALEHCTLRGEVQRRVIRLSSKTTPRVLPFFSDGGARLRSLCLADPPILPENEFPALTLLLLSASSESRITMGDLFKFLARCPRLEEAYVYDIQRNPSDASPASSLLISLPHLQHFYYTYRRDENFGWEKGVDPIEHILSHTSIPSTCHMYFTVDRGEYGGVTNRGILNSVCSHIQGKDAVSHAFLCLVAKKPTMQLVFPQGSLRLQFETSFDCIEILRSFRRLVSKTEDLRVRYISAGRYTEVVDSLETTLRTTFPNLKAISLIRQTCADYPGFYATVDGDPTDHVLHDYLVEPPRCRSPLPEAERIPCHPALDTLWVCVRDSKEEIALLQKTLADRAALGFPIRCVIVQHYFGDDSTAVSQLRALNAEEVILMETRALQSLREVDWAVTLPERFSLPSVLCRDWPTKWYWVEKDTRSRQIKEDSDSE